MSERRRTGVDDALCVKKRDSGRTVGYTEAIQKRVVSKRERDVRTRQVPLELKDQVVYEVRQIEENVRKRLGGPKTSKSANRAKRLMGRTRRLLQSIRKQPEVFFNLSAELKFDARLQTLYDAAIQVLKEEFADEPDRLEDAISRIHKYARQKLRSP